MGSESTVKALALTNGLSFSSDAILYAQATKAKHQNLVYNSPNTNDLEKRPQELLLTGTDGYSVCLSAVTPVPGRKPVKVSCISNKLSLSNNRVPGAEYDEIQVDFVLEPDFYKKKTDSGRPITRIVSTCGVDEMNIWPWHDCAIESTCSFCGINATHRLARFDDDLLYAFRLKNLANPMQTWLEVRNRVLPEVAQAIELASNEECYAEHVHVIISSGNLPHHLLDDQARIYSDIAAVIKERSPVTIASEGITAVTAPPNDLSLLQSMKNAGIGTIVLNLEAFSPESFALHCPGKSAIGRDHFLLALLESVNVFGWARAWSNFVLGLEEPESLLDGCEWLAARGVTPGANILHLDHGATTIATPPSTQEAVFFYRKLADIYRYFNHKPFFCAKALRSSLANEAFDQRLGSS